MPGMSGMSGVAPLTTARLFAWSPSPLFLIGCVLALGLYLAGVITLHRRGDRWPIGRTIAYVLGIASVLLMTCTGFGTYGMLLFSIHMVQHMVLSMLSPILLLLGAPLTLALRALKVAPRGHTGPREVLVRLLHSRFVRVIASPFFSLPLFVASLYGLYFTPLFGDLMGSSVGHPLMLVHFVFVGLLFFWPIIGIDPAPHRPGYVLRLLELFVGMPFHAFFGIAMMSSTTLVADTFAHPPAAWNIAALSDQRVGGGIAWAFSEVPTLLVLAAVFIQWVRAEGRLARRRDRAAARSGGDAELAAYNEYLASLNRMSGARRPAGGAVTPPKPAGPSAT